MFESINSLKQLKIILFGDKDIIQKKLDRVKGEEYIKSKLEELDGCEKGSSIALSWVKDYFHCKGLPIFSQIKHDELVLELMHKTFNQSQEYELNKMIRKKGITDGIYLYLAELRCNLNFSDRDNNVLFNSVNSKYRFKENIDKLRENKVIDIEIPITNKAILKEQEIIRLNNLAMKTFKESTVEQLALREKEGMPTLKELGNARQLEMVFGKVEGCYYILKDKMYGKYWCVVTCRAWGVDENGRMKSYQKSHKVGAFEDLLKTKEYAEFVLRLAEEDQLRYNNKKEQAINIRKKLEGEVDIDKVRKMMGLDGEQEEDIDIF